MGTMVEVVHLLDPRARLGGRPTSSWEVEDSIKDALLYKT